MTNSSFQDLRRIALTALWRTPTQPRDLIQSLGRCARNLRLALLSSDPRLTLRRGFFSVGHGPFVLTGEEDSEMCVWEPVVVMMTVLQGGGEGGRVGSSLKGIEVSSQTGL